DGGPGPPRRPSATAAGKQADRVRVQVVAALSRTWHMRYPPLLTNSAARTRQSLPEGRPSRGLAPAAASDGFQRPHPLVHAGAPPRFTAAPVAPGSRVPSACSTAPWT